MLFKKLLFILLILTSVSTSFSQQPPVFITDSLERYIERGMKDWNIPGLAITIVKDGKIVFIKGYGIKEMESDMFTWHHGPPNDEQYIKFIKELEYLFLIYPKFSEE